MTGFKNFNTETLEQIAKGDDSFISKMLQAYCDQAPGLLETLQSALKEKNSAAIRSSAHRLRPSFHYLGRPDVSALLERIEMSAETVPADQLMPLYDQVFTSASLMLDEANEALRQQTKS
jgi:HPt (histidine-containing phosphotransfer) domain-containing protein